MSKSELKIGVLGLNEGNGHPFSYSAIFNGYDPQALETRCPFALIREYRPRDHRNEVFVEGAKVTHIWTQERALSEDVAAVARIPNIASEPEELIGKVDAVLLARDDPENHLAMARPFLDAGIPIFIDKLLASTEEDLKTLLALASPEQILMAGSPMRFTRDLEAAARALTDGRTVKTIHGTSTVNWVRYAHHLLEGVVVLLGTAVSRVRSLSESPDRDVLQLEFESGVNVILEFVKNLSLPISFRCYSLEQPPLEVPFSDFFYSFHHMLNSFVRYIRTGTPPFPRSEMIQIARIVIAGAESRRRGGAFVAPASIAPQL